MIQADESSANLAGNAIRTPGSYRSAMSSAILQPGQLEPAAGVFPTRRLPAPGPFAARARRLRALAPGHGLEPLLRFAARLAESQQRLWEDSAPQALPSVDLLARCREAAMPPLAAPGWWPGPGWHDLLYRLVAELAPAAPDPSALAVRAQAPGAWLEVQARALLGLDGAALDLAAAPLIGAALQVCWTGAAARLNPGDIAGPGQGETRPGVCPVCGALPVAAVLRINGVEDGLRYLHCGLCASEWHVVRAKCSLCDNRRGVAYLSLTVPDADQEPEHQSAVQAETCPECRGYLKLCRLERDPHLDPWADDLATLALDLLVEREGFERVGLNFVLLQGEQGSKAQVINARANGRICNRSVWPCWSRCFGVPESQMVFFAVLHEELAWADCLLCGDLQSILPAEGGEIRGAWRLRVDALLGTRTPH